MPAKLKAVETERQELVSFRDLESIIGNLHRWTELLAFRCCDELHGVSLQVADQIWNEAEKLKTAYYEAYKAEYQKDEQNSERKAA